mmetsp:Transcript_14271/g.21759  ORF Transcript_14271/g.21759 Transcript_14271/m.21759 type:complete len:220 (+) Transcript_14271:101-760(+)
MIDQPGSYDVICNCRTQKSFDHVGNRRFRVIIENHSISYEAAKSKLDKSLIVMSIFKTIQDAGGNFIRKSRNNNSTWELLSSGQAREKIGHSLRDAISAQDQSSRRDIHSVLGGGRGNALQKLQLKKTRRLSLITGSYSVIKDLANSTFKQSPCVPEAVKSFSSFYNTYDSDEDCKSISSQSTSSRTEEEYNFEPLEVVSFEQSYSEDISSLLSSWVEQ